MSDNVLMLLIGLGGLVILPMLIITAAAVVVTICTHNCRCECCDAGENDRCYNPTVQGWHPRPEHD